MVISMRPSVTVSMAEAMIGMFRTMLRVIREPMSTSDGSTSDRPGCSNTCARASASRGLPLGFAGIANLLGSRDRGAEHLHRPARKAGPAVEHPGAELAPVDSTPAARFLGRGGRIPAGLRKRLRGAGPALRNPLPLRERVVDPSETRIDGVRGACREIPLTRLVAR